MQKARPSKPLERLRQVGRPFSSKLACFFALMFWMPLFILACDTFGKIHSSAFDMLVASIFMTVIMQIAMYEFFAAPLIDDPTGRIHRQAVVEINFFISKLAPWYWLWKSFSVKRNFSHQTLT